MLMPPNPERELVLRLVQRIGNQCPAEKRIRELTRKELDWSTVVDVSSRHGVLPLLHNLFRDLDSDPPTAVEQSLRERYKRQTFENVTHVDQLHTIVQALRQQEIRVLPYKGPVLTQVAYDELGQRGFSDLDLLVAPEDILDAREILQSIGYKQINLVGVDPARLIAEPLFRWGGEFHFKKDGKIPVELRYRFIGKTADRQEIFYELWNNRTSQTVAGDEFPALSPEDRLIVLLAHGTKHGWNRLSWICDIALLLQQHTVDWDTVLERSEKYGWQSAISLGLAVTAEFADMELPSSVRQTVADKNRVHFGLSIIQRLYQEPKRYSRMNLNTVMSVLYLNNSTTDSVTEFIDIVFSPWEKDYEWISLPPSLYPLYYLVRPCRLSVNTLKRVAGWE